MENWWNQNIVNPVRRTVGLPGYGDTNTARLQQAYLGDPRGVVGANAAEAQRIYNLKQQQEEAAAIINAEMAQRAAQESAIASVGGGGGGTGQVTTDLSGKIQALNDLYGVIYNDLANLTKEKRASLESSYGDQTKNLQDTYQDVSAQLPMQYGAQGIGQSSYYAKAAGRAEDAYNQNTKALQDAQTQSLAELGRFYQTNLGNFQGQQAALAGYGGVGTQADAAALDTQLNQLGQARTGLQTQGQNIAGLSAIAPSQNTGAAQLRKMLGELSGSSIPDFAKQTIAQNEIKKSGQDQTYYTDYFDRLRQQTPGA